MPINTDLEPVPSRQDPDNFSAYMDTWLSKISTWTTEANSTAADVNSDQIAASTSASNAATSETNAEAAASTASSAANFVGAWSTLTGALDIPASVLHENKYWNLVQDIADVTTIEPGTNSAYWKVDGFEDVNDLGTISTNTTINVGDGNVVECTIAGDLTFTFSGFVATGTADYLTIIMEAAGDYTITWPASVKWNEDTEPTWSSSGNRDIAFFVTIDGGTALMGSKLYEGVA